MKTSEDTTNMWMCCNAHVKTLLALIFFFTLSILTAQVNTGGNSNTSNHNKQIIGYITNWDAWKQPTAGVPAQGALTHLNIDYSKYTILNYSFFGVANDGSLHSGDHRNKNIYQPGAQQQPAELLFGDVYSSWDFHILFGEIEAVNYISETIKQRAEALGYVVQVGGNTWSHPEWGINGALPLPLPKEGGAPGLINLAHQKGVKVMASIGGWSMCKHFPEMAADPVKRARFIEDCKKLISMGFDGIDLDWEYPGPYAGMNFTGSQADFVNFENLVQEIRNAIGTDKLITAAFSADPIKLDGFDWSKLSNTMNYFNMMTYDFAGGFSEKAGHNSPIYPYTNAEVSSFNWQSTFLKLTEMGVPKSKICMGAPFYGRGVVTNGTADLNVATVKRAETVQPDGPIQTASDFTNWPRDVYDGTPNYFYIKQKALSPNSGWTRKWDDEAKVPYLVKGNFFLSYDDEESIGHKAQFINDNGLGGTIVWTVYGDLEFGGSVTNYGTKLKKWSEVKSPLVNKINEVFANGNGGNVLPAVSITSPESGATFNDGGTVNIEANATDSDGSITKVEFYNGSVLLGEKTNTPYTFSWNTIPTGNYTISVKAIDNENGESTSFVSITVNGSGDNELPIVSIISPETGATFNDGSTVNIEANATDGDGNITKVEFYSGSIMLGEDLNAPYTFSWNNVAVGSHTISAKAIDNENGKSTSSVSITVNGNDSGSCTATTWVSGQAYNGGEVVSHEGHEYSAKWWTNQNPIGSNEWEDLGSCNDDDDGNGDCTATAWISGQAYNGGEVVSHEGHEYSAKWWTNQNPVGSNEWDDLGACDDDGNDDNAPQVSITSPNNGQSYLQGSTVIINANATDSDGSIAKVEFFSNGNKLGEDTSSPYSYTWNNAQIGSYSLTAKATDNSNLSTTSTIVSISITSDGDGDCDNENFKVVGYMPSWQGSATTIQYDKLTHINYSFLLPNSNGSLQAVDGAGKLQQIVTLGHQQGVKVLIAVGGWMNGNDSAFASLASNASTRTTFVNNLVNFVEQYNLDGVDMDWEYPREGNEPQNYELLMQELGQAMHSRGKLLTAAVVVSGWNADGVLSGVFDDIDFLNIMAYDGPDHSSYAQAQGGLNYWLGRGLPKSKAVLGVPFYSRPEAKSYADLLAQGADPYSDVFQGNNYNGITTIKSKTELALDQAGGIMIWELSHDTSNIQFSLLNAINEVAGDPCGEDDGDDDNVSPVVSIIAPASGNVFTEGDAVTISVNASDSDGNIAKVEFYNGNTLLGEDSSAPYTYSWNNITEGNYALTAKATDNEGAITNSSTVSITVNSDDDDGDGNCNEAQYIENGGYVAGSQVQNDGNVYQCRDYPNSGWCNGASWAYEPGTGSHWGDAWELVGECSGDTNNSLSVSITSPANGQSFIQGNSIVINANASGGTITKVEFFSNGTKLGEDTSSPYSFSWNNTQIGSYSLTAVATNNTQSVTSNSVNVSVTTSGGGNGELASKILVGYWHNFNNGSTTPRLSEVSQDWDVICIAFAEPVGGSTSNMQFNPYEIYGGNAQTFINDVATVQSRGQKVLISIGGANARVELNTEQEKNEFTSTMTNIINTYGFDGLDIDLEGSSLSLDGGDSDFRNPTTPKIVNLIAATKTIRNNVGASDFILSMAPETAYVQGAYGTYSGIFGAYLPVVHNLRNEMTYIHVQHYNTGSMFGRDGQVYQPATADFHVAMAEMLITGFPVAQTGLTFPGLRADQVAIGLPASSQAASSGYTSEAVVQQALDYLINGTPYPNKSYTTIGTYPEFRGLMTWSINWDLANSSTFSSSHRAYLNGTSNSMAIANNNVNIISIAVNKEMDEVLVYPNPVTDGVLYIKQSLVKSSAFKLQIFNMSGIQVMEFDGKLNSNDNNIKSFDLSNLMQGAYFYYLSMSGEKIKGTIIKK